MRLKIILDLTSLKLFLMSTRESSWIGSLYIQIFSDLDPRVFNPL